MDSGTTGHYIAMKDMNCLRDVQTSKANEVVTVTLPTGEKIKSTHTGFLNLPTIKAQQRVHVFECLWGSLLSIGDLADIGLVTVFDAEAAYVVDKTSKEVVLTGVRDEHTRLWMIKLSPITPQEEHRAINEAMRSRNKCVTYIRTKNTNSKKSENSDFFSLVKKSGNSNAACQQTLDSAGDRVEFFGRVFCSATESTLMQAVKKRWIEYPGITPAILKRHQKRLRTHENAAGHLDQVHQNHKTQASPHITVTSTEDKEPQYIITTIYKEVNHLDATGRLPHVSHEGHQYILVLYSEGANHIKAIPMKDRTKHSYVKAHQEAYTFYEEHGYAPTFQRMDNEVSNEFMQYLKKKAITVDLVPPHQHRRNKAERAIRTFKNHFIAALAGVDPSFPMAAWNELIPQVEATLNMLRPSTMHPRMSAWEALHGKYDFDAHPMAPPGTAVTIHEKPGQRDSWSKHGIKGFYLGPAMDTYRCYRVWTKHKHSTRTTDTVAWHPHGYEWEAHSTLDVITGAADIMAKALQQLTTTDGSRQPVNTIAVEIQRQFNDLKRIYGQTNVDLHCNDEEQDTPEEETAAIQRVETAEKVAPATCEQPPARRSKRRKHKTLNRANAVLPDHLAEALEIAATFKRRHGPSTVLHDKYTSKRYINKAVQLAQRRLVKSRASWKHWASSPGVELDSGGVPFFVDRTQASFANTAVDLDAEGNKLTWGNALRSPEGDIWLQKHGEEISRLFDSDTIRLTLSMNLPPGKKPAYYNPQVRTKIKEGVLQYRVRGTIGGDKVMYDGDTAAHTASMQLIKIFLNSVVSQKDAKFMTADIKDFYLGTPLREPEYMRIKLDHIPQDVIAKYDMDKYAHNGSVIVAVHKGIYGLPQAGKLAQDRLIKHLATHGYHLADNTPCLFKHESNSVSFTLVVDDFGIKYTKSEDADHLLAALRELYIMTEDRAVTQKFVGITIEHERNKNIIYMSMPGYCEKALHANASAVQNTLEPSRHSDTRPPNTEHNSSRRGNYHQQLVNMWMQKPQHLCKKSQVSSYSTVEPLIPPCLVL
jgi:hypothetical protein